MIPSLPDRPRPGATSSAELRFALLASLAFLLLGLPRMLLHEMWRDECSSWLFAASRSPWELFANTAYEGHPSLWFLSLWLLRRVVDHPVAMQIFHLLLATGSTFLLVRFAPWSRSMRLLMAGGYFLFFEYTLLSRNYALGVLLLWGFCALAGARKHVEGKRGVLAAGGLLFLLAQTNAFATILTLAGVVWLGVDGLRGGDTASPRLPLWKLGLAAGMALGGAALAAADMVPPPDSGVYTGWKLTLDSTALWQRLAALERGFLPFPRPGLDFWDTTILDPWPGVRAVLAGALVLAFVWVLRKRPAALAFWLTATLGIWAFLYTKFPGHLRHHGHLFLALLAALWLAHGERSRGSKTAGTALLLPLLVVHLAAGIYASWMDLRHPFSSSRKAARFILEKGLDRLPLAGHPDHPSLCVGMWLGREMYYPRGDRVGTWVIWDRGRQEHITVDEALERVRRRAKELGKPMLLVTGFLFRPVPAGLEELYRTGPAIVREVWAVYRVDPPDGAP